MMTAIERETQKPSLRAKLTLTTTMKRMHLRLATQTAMPTLKQKRWLTMTGKPTTIHLMS
jgi:hypothetical protein